MHNLHFPDVASGSERALRKERKKARGEKKKDNLFQQLVRFRGSGVTGHQLRSCLCIGDGMPSSHYSLLLCSSPWVSQPTASQSVSLRMKQVQIAPFKPKIGKSSYGSLLKPRCKTQRALSYWRKCVDCQVVSCRRDKGRFVRRKEKEKKERKKNFIIDVLLKTVLW